MCVRMQEKTGETVPLAIPRVVKGLIGLGLRQMSRTSRNNEISTSFTAGRQWSRWALLFSLAFSMLLALSMLVESESRHTS